MLNKISKGNFIVYSKSVFYSVIIYKKIILPFCSLVFEVWLFFFLTMAERRFWPRYPSLFLLIVNHIACLRFFVFSYSGFKIQPSSEAVILTTPVSHRFHAYFRQPGTQLMVDSYRNYLKTIKLSFPGKFISNVRPGSHRMSN